MQNQPQFIRHDGTSQAGRTLKALDPNYVLVDERSTKDLLAFAQKYAQELHYFNESNVSDGDWSGFLGGLSLEDIQAYLNDPHQFRADPQKQALLNRPHLTLFLTFLELLKNARLQMNDLTRRHLEFYYREALRLNSRNGLPDRVHLVVELADNQEQFLLPAGTLFPAGQDTQGEPIYYRSDEDLVANRAVVESVKSLFADKKVIGIPEARENPDILIELIPSNQDVLGEGKLAERSLMAMLMMALSTPVPGAKLDPYPDGRRVDSTLLDELDTLLNFIPNVLYMPVSTFRSLMQQKDDQVVAYEQWATVNNTLETAARVRLNEPKFVLDRSEPANFEKNLLAALGLATFGNFFNELPEVQDVYDLYRRRDRQDVIDFIDTSFYMPLEDFSKIIGIVEDINAGWRQVYEILRSAARKKQLSDPELTLQPPQIRAYDADKFTALIARTLGEIDYSSIQGARPTSLDACRDRIVELETYFHVTAEQFIFIRRTIANGDNAQPWELDQVYTILEDAHRDKALVSRRNDLKTIREKEGFQAMILYALGDPNQGDNLPDSKKFEALDPVQDSDYLTSQLFLEPANFTFILNVQLKGQNATADDWDHVYTILETSQRRKRQWVDPLAQIEKWENVYVAPDATTLQVRNGAEEEDTTPRWRTFGKGFSPEDGNGANPIPGRIGFAISSPMLELAEGKRAITLTLEFLEENFDRDAIALDIQNPSPFRFLLSTEKEMREVENVELQLLDPGTKIPGVEQAFARALQATLLLDEQTPAVTALVSGSEDILPWPVLKILLADLPQEKDGPLKRYRAFEHLALERIHLRVDVSGITKFAGQNDNGVLDPKNPFEPFGTSPVTGSSFSFAQLELCSKKLDQLTFNIDWLGAPDDFSSYYLGYLKSDERETDPTGNLSTSPFSDNTNLKAGLKLFDNRSFYDMGSLQLFNANSNNKKKGAASPGQSVIGQDAITAGYQNYHRTIFSSAVPEVLGWPRYWQLELLAPDFQHTAYPRVAAGCANKIVPGTGSDPKPQPFIVNQPYTPKIKRLMIGYSSSQVIDLTRNDLDQQVDRLYHILPFGYYDLAASTAAPYSFLPEIQNEGELTIGLKDLAPPQNLCLLFQMAEGSADPDLEREPVQWSFLDGNSWSSLDDGRLLSDSTNGLLNSGILRFNLPAVKPSSLMPPGLYWLRAAIARNSRSVADIIAIQPSAPQRHLRFSEQRSEPPGSTIASG